MTTPSLRNVAFAVAENVATITVNRPHVHNALDRATVEDLHKALSAVRDAGISVFILTGAGKKAFISGADINAIRERRRNDALEGINSRLMSAVESHESVAIAAVNGYALGGGLELALACDLRIASENAVFGLPETGLGIIPGAGGTQRLARVVGLGRAKEMILAGGRWNADQALAAGLVSEVAPAPQLLERAQILAHKVLARGPLATRLAKAALNASSQLPQTAGLQYELALQGIAFESEDKREGTTAFLEKRAARWTGR
jgi:enoyl-CoA hydratase